MRQRIKTLAAAQDVFRAIGRPSRQAAADGDPSPSRCISKIVDSRCREPASRPPSPAIDRVVPAPHDIRLYSAFARVFASSTRDCRRGRFAGHTVRIRHSDIGKPVVRNACIHVATQRKIIENWRRSTIPMFPCLTPSHLSRKKTTA